MKNSEWHGYHILAWLGQALLAIAIVVVALKGNWQGVLGLTGFFVAAVLFVQMKGRMPALFDMLFVVAALVNAGGWVWNWYDLVWGYDEAAHAYTTFALTLALGYVVYGALLPSFRNHQWLFILTITSFGIAIGAMWEVAEWTYEILVPGQFLLGLNDAMIDLIMDSIGAGMAACISVWHVHKHVPRQTA